MNTRLRVDAQEFESSPLKDAFLQLLSDAKRRHKDRAAIAGGERLEALSDAAYDVVAWGFDFYNER